METTAEAQKRIDECRATHATTLDLSDLALTHIPDEVFTLIQLTELNLGDYDAGPANNRITELSPAIGRLQNLTRLYVSNNQLSTLLAVEAIIPCHCPGCRTSQAPAITR